MLIEPGKDNVSVITYLDVLEEAIVDNHPLVGGEYTLENILIYHNMYIKGAIWSSTKHKLMGNGIYFVVLGQFAIICETPAGAKSLLTKISAIMHSPTGEDSLNELLRNAQELFFQQPIA